MAGPRARRCQVGARRSPSSVPSKRTTPRTSFSACFPRRARHPPLPAQADGRRVHRPLLGATPPAALRRTCSPHAAQAWLPDRGGLRRPWPTPRSPPLNRFMRPKRSHADNERNRGGPLQREKLPSSTSKPPFAPGSRSHAKGDSETVISIKHEPSSVANPPIHRDLPANWRSRIEPASRPTLATPPAKFPQSVRDCPS